MYFQSHFTDWCDMCFLANFFYVNTAALIHVNIRVRSWNNGMRCMSLYILIGWGNGLVPTGKKPLHKPILTQMYVTHIASPAHIELKFPYSFIWIMNKMTRFFKFPSSICTPEFTTKLDLLNIKKNLKNIPGKLFACLCVWFVCHWKSSVEEWKN